MSSKIITSVKGTRDFYPEDMAFRKWLFGKMRNLSESFGYQEYDGPILEPLELYSAKSGEELVKQQTFVLTDRGERQLALRPEMTPTLARMVANKQNALPKPIRWFNIGPRFRYEQPQKGRFREFYQWDIDLVGSTVPETDAEILAIAAEFLKSLKLSPEEAKIKVNSRQLMEQKLNLIGISKDKVALVFRAIDRREKMEPSEWIKWLIDLGLTKLQTEDLIKILDDKDFANESETLTRIFSTLEDFGVREYFEFDPNIVRGLEYYTGIVFEGRDIEGKYRAILGGGRYDNLVEIVGGAPLSGIGFAAGDAVIEEILRDKGKIPTSFSEKPKILVTVFNEELMRDSLKAVKKLREFGCDAAIYPELIKLDKQIKYADDLNFTYVVIIGPDEASKGIATLKNMTEKTQKEISLEDLPNELK
jgi:histidyl-tRNA synthetase